MARRHQQLRPEHLLKVLLEERDGLARQLITTAGGKPNGIDAEVEQVLAKTPRVEGGRASSISRPRPRACSPAPRTTRKRRATSSSPPSGCWPRRGRGRRGRQPAQEDRRHAAALDAAVASVRKGKTADSAGAEDQYDALKRYARDVTEAARDGKVDPVIGRDEEIRRTIQVLARRTKNNPVLIGEPGVGKTAIVEGLAQRMVNGDVPESLKDKRLLSLTWAA
jgi:ATP-dependent Clp protease ATP-binding subunit ClpB